MTEYELVNKITGQTKFAWAHYCGFGPHTEVFKENNLDPAEWEIVMYEYID
jgi:uncharacterized protein YodC (DUF2158 family)